MVLQKPYESLIMLVMAYSTEAWTIKNTDEATIEVSIRGKDSA